MEVVRQSASHAHTDTARQRERETEFIHISQTEHTTHGYIAKQKEEKLKRERERAKKTIPAVGGIVGGWTAILLVFADCRRRFVFLSLQIRASTIFWR